MKSRKFGVFAFVLVTSLMLTLAGCSDVAGALGAATSEESPFDLFVGMVSGKSFAANTAFASTVSEGEGRWVIIQPEIEVPPVLGTELIIIEPGVDIPPVLGTEWVMLEPEVDIPPVLGTDWVIVEPAREVPPVYGTELIIIEPEEDIPPVLGTEWVIIEPAIDFPPVLGDCIDDEYGYAAPVALKNSVLINVASPMTIILNAGTVRRGAITLTQSGGNYIMTGGLDNNESLFADLVIKTGNGNEANCTNVATINGDIVTLGAGNRLIMTATESEYKIINEGHYEILVPGYTIPAVWGYEILVPGYHKDAVWGYEVIVPGYTTDPVWGYEILVPGYHKDAVWGYEIIVPGYTADPVWGYEILVPGYTIPEVKEWVEGAIVTNTTRKVYIGYNPQTDSIELGGIANVGFVFAEAAITDNQDNSLTVVLTLEEGLNDLFKTIECALWDVEDIPENVYEEMENLTATFYYESGEQAYIGIRVQF